MIKYDQLSFYLILILIIIGVSFLIGTNIVNIVDKKLSNISINMPNITLPTPTFTVHMDENKNPIMTGGFNEKHYTINDNATYYKDPAQLNEKQRLKLKERGKFNRMTLQDYKNWLGLFHDDIYELSRKYPQCVIHYGKYMEGKLTNEDLIAIQSINKSNTYKVKSYSAETSNHLI